MRVQTHISMTALKGLDSRVSTRDSGEIPANQMAEMIRRLEQLEAERKLDQSELQEERRKMDVERGLFAEERLALTSGNVSTPCILA